MNVLKWSFRCEISHSAVWALCLGIKEFGNYSRKRKQSEGNTYSRHLKVFQSFFKLKSFSFFFVWSSQLRWALVKSTVDLKYRWWVTGRGKKKEKKSTIPVKKTGRGGRDTSQPGGLLPPGSFTHFSPFAQSGWKEVDEGWESIFSSCQEFVRCACVDGWMLPFSLRGSSLICRAVQEGNSSVLIFLKLF